MSNVMLVESAMSRALADLGVASYLLDMFATGGADEIDGRTLNQPETLLMLARALRADADQLGEAYHIIEMLPANALDDPDEAL